MVTESTGKGIVLVSLFAMYPAICAGKGSNVC